MYFCPFLYQLVFFYSLIFRNCLYVRDRLAFLSISCQIFSQFLICVSTVYGGFCCAKCFCTLFYSKNILIFHIIGMVFLPSSCNYIHFCLLLVLFTIMSWVHPFGIYLNIQCEIKMDFCIFPDGFSVLPAPFIKKLFSQVI